MLSGLEIEDKSVAYAEEQNSCYCNDLDGHAIGAKWARDHYESLISSGELLRRDELAVFLKALQQASDMAHSERPDSRHCIAKLAYQSVIDHINTKKS